MGVQNILIIYRGIGIVSAGLAVERSDYVQQISHGGHNCGFLSQIATVGAGALAFQKVSSGKQRPHKATTRNMEDIVSKIPLY